MKFFVMILVTIGLVVADNNKVSFIIHLQDLFRNITLYYRRIFGKDYTYIFDKDYRYIFGKDNRYIFDKD